MPGFPEIYSICTSEDCMAHRESMSVVLDLVRPFGVTALAMLAALLLMYPPDTASAQASFDLIADDFERTPST